MKRSEIIKIIEKHLESTKRGVYLGLEVDLDAPYRLLDDLEKAGMLPPDKRPAHSQLTTKDWKIERDMWVQKTFAWEPEDE